ncbi:hypothetical protein [Streptomyces sp. SYP-A7185]|uniref:hypothetical protein n=1 Tax=Streptomyces sp. SYP-A7185 TaxID=3040076 RepID=UPI0038F646FE
MSVSLYYGARRTAALMPLETAAIERIVAARMSSFPYEDEEGLCLYDDSGLEPGEIVNGSTKLPPDDARVLPVIAHMLEAVTELRRALPHAQWRVHLDDLDIPWDEEQGYILPGADDANLTAEPGDR